MKSTMKPIILVVLGAAAILFLFSCTEKQSEDITQTVNKDGAVETGIQVKHLDSLHDLLITSHKVWVNEAGLLDRSRRE
ncbi:MAG: hypothetical protein RLZZ28_221 [Bacteroidota bacterium]|jgi:hypothetical protein